MSFLIACAITVHGKIGLMDKTQARTKLQCCYFIAVCVIHDVIVDDFITVPLSSQHAHAAYDTGHSSSHHRSSHTVVDDIEVITRAGYQVHRY